jgi:anti-anti-sigma regulatory factor
MATNAVWVPIDGDRIIEALQAAYEKLDTAGAEMTLDFSAVRRMDAASLSELEKLASAAEAKPVKVVLRGVNVDVYKVLKLLKIARRFGFEA